MNIEHPKGGPKARFFLSFGFDPEPPDVMAAALIGHFILNREAILPSTSVTPERAVIDGPLVSPDGRNPQVRSVWKREDDDASAWRLITAFPLGHR